MAQNVGCINFAENYDPNATFNEVQLHLQQLNDGFELGDLLSSGVHELMARRWNLVANSAMSACMTDDLTYILLSDMFRDREFGSGIYDGRENWEKIRKSYDYRFPGAIVFT